MDTLAKNFEKMAITKGGCDEERAGSPMDVADEDVVDEILHQKFDCLQAESSDNDDGSNDSDWRNIGGEPKVSASLHRTERSFFSTGAAGGNGYSWFIPCEPNSFLEEKTSDNETLEGKKTHLVGTDDSVEVQLHVGDTAPTPSSGVTSSGKDNAPAERTFKYTERDQATEERRKRAQAISEIQCRVDEMTMTLNRLETTHKPTLQYKPSTYATIASRGCSKPDGATLERVSAPSPAPFPLRGHTVLRSSVYRSAEAPVPAPIPLSTSELGSGNLYGSHYHYRAGVTATRKPSNENHRANRQRNPGAKSVSPGSDFQDLEPDIRKMMDIELGRVVTKEVTITSSEEEGCKMNDPYETATQPVKSQSPDRAFAKTNGCREKTTKLANAKDARSLKHQDRGQSSIGSNTIPPFLQRDCPYPYLDRPVKCTIKPDPSKKQIVGLADEKKASIKLSPPTHRAAAPKPTEICVILDSSNAEIDKFLLPLRFNLEKLWDMTSSSSGVNQMSMLIPNGKIDFTRDKLDFLSFFDAACKNKEANRTPEQPVIAGLAAAMPHLDSLSWTPKSVRYVYIFTNLSGWDNDDDVLRLQLRSALEHLPSDAKTLVSRWKSDNEPLEDALDDCEKQFNTFAILNLKEKASFVVHDENLLKGLIDSLKNATLSTRKKLIKISEKKQMHSFSKLKRSPDFKVPVIKSEATVFRMKPVETIGDVLCRQQPTIHNTVCRMSRDGAISHLNHNEVFSMGKLGFKRGTGMNFMFKALKLDEINGTKSASSFEYHRNRAFVAAVACFFATQYNKEHRPENCATIRFLQGCVVESSPKKGQQRVFYAEELPTSDGSIVEFTQFCDKKGHWDESKADESLLHFALTCFKLSGGDLMLSGLKGIKIKNVFVLTAPTLLSKTDGDAHTSQCTKEYIKDFRVKTRGVMEEKGWNKKKPVKNSTREPGIFSGLFK